MKKQDNKKKEIWEGKGKESEERGFVRKREEKKYYENDEAFIKNDHRKKNRERENYEGWWDKQVMTEIKKWLRNETNSQQLNRGRVREGREDKE